MDTYVEMAALRTAQNLGRNRPNPPTNPEESKKQIWMRRLFLGGLGLLCLLQAIVLVALRSRSSCSANPPSNLEQVLEHGWAYFNYSLYQVSSERQPWEVARENCKTMKSELVIINNQEKHKFIQSLLKGQSQAWVGLTNKHSVWRWVDGTPATTWGTDSIPGECMTVSEKSAMPVKYDCMYSQMWICEKPVYKW